MYVTVVTCNREMTSVQWYATVEKDLTWYRCFLFRLLKAIKLE